ncbi:integrase family protein [Natrialba magadii ATCC 43099]|uniref:Integrase family protein n=1 Tax=Natrialba magadii (strain ATCC 43099 / DSM 3394 / CCM 3739 / CIP 104546 / IAM 13178 / JCM 8861 / NBRC 102185 / NCIMB 2190 / MS3) TaxID=547559 RepID=D3SX23_NATMM|nr:site-specific integrase [Natrialba magadii]ADD03843.1 integrase family protein [Natrialba magadii ATCC 43099]ELY33503.1 integrase family protein [Natrialba magadii ATCC 43099]
MKLEPYENQDGYRVSLTDEERDKLYKHIDSTTSSLGWGLAAYSGLRRWEIEHVRYKDLRERDNGDYFLRVWEEGAKGGKYRETPVPESLAIKIETIEETADVNPDDEVIDHHMRTVIRHVQQAAKDLGSDTGDEGWDYLGLHDGRRTFANSLLDADVSPLQVMEWGGWDDWRTFRDHYLTSFSEQHQHEELQKVSWM